MERDITKQGSPRKSMTTNRGKLSQSDTTIPIEWKISTKPIPYGYALSFMEQRVEEISEGRATECIWFLEHPSLYTAGTSASAKDLIDENKFPVHQTGRGGQFTYHGPGQRVIYPMLDLRRRGKDVRSYVSMLEEWVIQSLATFNVNGKRCAGRVGIWVSEGDGKENKIAAIGIRIRRWVAFHGISINVEPDLSHFDAIVPCGISDPNLGITSLVNLGLPVIMEDLDIALIAAFQKILRSNPTNTIL